MPLSKCSCEGCQLKDLFFGHVSDSVIENMCTSKIEKLFRKGTIIIKEGDEIKEFTYLKSGLVKLFKTSAPEKEQIICFAGPLDFVSLLSVFSDKSYHYSVMALEDSVTCSLDMDDIIRTIESNGKFGLGIIEKANRASDKIILEMLELKQKRLFGRIAYMLLFFSDRVYKKNIFELPVSRKEIAEFIGMTTENVIRTLSDFRKDGIIKIYGKTIEIVDKDRLMRIKEYS